MVGGHDERERGAHMRIRKRSFAICARGNLGVRPTLLFLTLLLCACLALCACSRSTASPTDGGVSASPTIIQTVTHSTPASSGPLACTLLERPQGVDVIVATLSCRVSGVAASQTSFTLSYTAAGPGSQQRQMGPPCSGSLHAGAGSCAQTYSLIAPIGSKPGSVAGELLPSHTPLGPVTPSPAPSNGTPGPGARPITTPAQP